MQELYTEKDMDAKICFKEGSRDTGFQWYEMKVGKFFDKLGGLTMSC